MSSASTIGVSGAGREGGERERGEREREREREGGRDGKEQSGCVQDHSSLRAF